MRVDPDRAEAWYQAISEFLESNAGEEDAYVPGSLVVALCKVIADASETVDAPDRKKIQAIAGLISHQIGLNDVVVFFGKDSDPDSIN